MKHPTSNIGTNGDELCWTNPCFMVLAGFKKITVPWKVVLTTE